MSPYSPRRSLVPGLAPLFLASLAIVATGCLAPGWYPGGYGGGYGYGRPAYGYGAPVYGYAPVYEYGRPRPYNAYYGGRSYDDDDHDRDNHHHGGGGWSGGGHRDSGQDYGRNDGDHHGGSHGNQVRAQRQVPNGGPSNEQRAERARLEAQANQTRAERSRERDTARNDTVRPARKTRAQMPDDRDYYVNPRD